MKIGLFILKLGIIFVLSSHIYADDWAMTLTAVDTDGIGSDDFITLGMCETCTDGWRYGEDEYDTPNPPTAYTDISFFNLHWYGQTDINDITCNQFEFASDFRSIHPNYVLQSWEIYAATGNGLSYDIPINLSWNAASVDSLSDDYELYLYIGNNSYNMRDYNSVTVTQSEFYLDEEDNPNVRVLLGACAGTGTTTHYLDVDNDGWGGSDISYDFCLGFAPESWVPNSEDLNDNLFCESNLIDDCSVCDGFNLDMDCTGLCFGEAYEDDCNVCSGGFSGHIENTDKDCNGDCFGEAYEDDCGVCSGGFSGHSANSDKDCTGECFGTIVFDECGICNGNGIPEENCDCEGNVVDCANVCGGTSTIEIICEDTDGDNLGNPGTETEGCVDLNNNRLDGCALPEFTLFLNDDGTVVYNSPSPFAGFQFDVNGATIIGNSGGDAESAGFFVSFSESMVLGFSLSGELLPAGCGNLLTLDLNGGAIGLNEIIISNPSGDPMSFSYYQGDEFDWTVDCSDEYPDCFYNYYDCLGECGGPIEIDECGICGGPGTIYCGGGTYECNEEDCPETIDYCLDLHQGANLISFYGLPEDASITNMMLDIEGIAIGVIGEGVAANYSETDGWMGSLNTISASGGYWVIMTGEINELFELCIRDAMPTNPSIQYNLHDGANLISFPVEGSLQISEGFPDDAEGSIIGLIGQGVAAYNDGWEWEGSLSSFEEGKGYWVITSEFLSFSFELGSLVRKKFDDSITLSYPEDYQVIQSTQQAFYFIEEIIIDGVSISRGDWILAYNGNTLVGARQWTGEMVDIPVMGNDGNAYSERYLKTGEIPQLKYLDNTTGELTDLYQIDIPSWENNGMYVLGSVDVKTILPETFLLTAYPNPFNPVTTLSFTVPYEGMLQLSIYNISGQLMEELAHEYITSGNVEYIWDAVNHPSGVYFARLNFGPQSYTQKLVLMK